MIMKIGTLSAVIAGMIFLVISILCIVGSVRLLTIAKGYKQKMEKVVKHVERRTRIEYNKIATLPPADLHRYLSVTFGKFLILASDSDVTEKDPKAHEILYRTALSDLLEYLGPETIDAIEYYYGTGYIIRWAKTAYRSIEYENIASGIINKDQSASTVSQRIAAWQ